MPISQTILPEFDNEMANTRKTLERVPDDKFDWKPHEKSTSLGNLTSHISNLPVWTVYTIERDNIDLQPVDEEPLRTEPITSRDEALAAFDENVAAARAALG